MEPGPWSFIIRHNIFLWSPRVRERILLGLGSIFDEAFALYLHEHVMDGYEWLVQHYNPGDEVYFFGLSALNDPDGRPLIKPTGFCHRVLLWCIHCSTPCSNGTKGTV
jgi:hypothetical protein